MKTLLKLVEALRPMEQKLLLQHYQLRSRASAHKKHELLTFLLHQQSPTDEEACNSLYQCPRCSAFFHLKKSLFEDLVNYLTAFEGRESGAEPPCEALGYKYLYQGKLLMEKNLKNGAICLYKKAIKIAEENEQLALKIAAKEALSVANVSVNGHAANETSMQKTLDTMKEVWAAQQGRNPALGVPANGEPVQAARVEKLYKISERTGSKKTKLLYYLHAIIYQSQEHNFDKAHSLGQEMEQLIASARSLQHPAMQLKARLEITRVLVRMGRYHEALGYAEQTQAILLNEAAGRKEILEILFYIYLRIEKAGLAENILQKIPVEKSGEHYWHFMRASLWFKMGKYRDSIQEINRYCSAMRHDPGLNIASKLLELLGIVEINDCDWFDFKLSAFRKTLAHRKLKEKDRMRSIYNALKNLHHTPACFMNTFAAKKKQLQLAAANIEGYWWDPIGLEIICTNAWMEEKLRAV